MEQAIPVTPRGWMGSSFVQTVLTNLQPHARSLPALAPEVLTVSLRGCTDKLAALLYRQPTPAPTVVVVHGISGSSDASYVRRSIIAGLGAKMNVIALNLRGSGLGGPLAQKMYHAGLFSDIEDALQAFLEHPAVTSLSLLGFSLGGNIILKYLARGRASLRTHVKAAATVSAPLDLAATCTHIDSLSYWPFRSHMLIGLARNCERLSLETDFPVSPARLRAIRKVHEFDDEVTAPMHQFANRHAYYAQASCGPDLKDITTPTLTIHAKDDPIVPIRTLLTSRAQAADCIRFLWSPFGGHVGFVQSWRTLRESWAVTHSIAFLRQHAG